MGKKEPCLKTGFTLIELLVVISVATILFSLGWAQYNNFNRQQILKQTALELKSDLVHAQELALSGKKECLGLFEGVLVIFGEESYTLNASCSQGSDVVLLGEAYRFPEGVRKTGGPEEILFKTLVGGADLEAEEMITLSGLGLEAKLEVAPSGIVRIITEL